MRSFFMRLGGCWSRANKPVLVVQMLAVMAVFVVLSECRRRSATTPETQAAESTARFDPRDFLCGLTGGPSGTSRADPLAGRRYTAEERSAARRTIAAALRSLGLRPTERGYVWDGETAESVPDEYLTDGCGGSGVNLTATLPAIPASDRWIVVGAHYDTVSTSPGADDNASGVTATLLVAEDLVRLRRRDANVMFVFFDQEEIGLVGSYFLAERLRGENVDVIAVHILDMVGWDGDRDRTVELTFCGRCGGDASGATVDYFSAIYSRAGEDIDDGPAGPIGQLLTRQSCRSDHVSFGQFGYRAVHVAEEFSGNDMSPHYHQPQDTCDTLDHGYLRAVAALVARAVAIQM